MSADQKAATLTQMRLALDAIVKLAREQPPFSEAKHELTAIADAQRAQIRRVEEFRVLVA